MNIFYFCPSFRLHWFYFESQSTNSKTSEETSFIDYWPPMSSASNSQRTVNAALTSGCQTKEKELPTISVKHLEKRRRRGRKRERRRIRRQEERAVLQTEQPTKQVSPTTGRISCNSLPAHYHLRHSEENERDSDVPDYIYESYNDSLVDAYRWESSIQKSDRKR